MFFGLELHFSCFRYENVRQLSDQVRSRETTLAQNIARYLYVERVLSRFGVHGRRRIPIFFSSQRSTTISMARSSIDVKFNEIVLYCTDVLIHFVFAIAFDVASISLSHLASG
jgi:hypothetical protein